MGYGWQIGRLNFWFLPHWSGVCEHISTQWTIVFLLDYYTSACNVCRFSTNASTFLQIFTHGGRQWRQPQHKTIFLRLVRLIQCQVFTFHLLTVSFAFWFSFMWVWLHRTPRFQQWWLSLIRHFIFCLCASCIPQSISRWKQTISCRCVSLYCILWSNGKQFVAHGIKFMQVLPNPTSRLTSFHQHTLCTLQQTVVKRRLAKRPWLEAICFVGFPHSKRLSLAVPNQLI